MDRLQGHPGGTVARGAAAAAMAAILAIASACNRDPPRMTECLGNRPAAERTKDVAPPNCDPALPGAPQPVAVAPATLSETAASG